MPDGSDHVGASFRGVPFFVDSAARSGGRRLVVHEFPLRPDPFVEDLDRKARRFKVQGYVIGDDYISQRDALMSALEDTAGPGELVHPYYGTRRAICDSVEVTETADGGGRAVFSIDFVETPVQAPTPAIAADASSKMAASADAAKSATRAELQEKFSAARLPSFALASASSAIERAASALDSKLAPVVSSAQELAHLNGQLTLLIAESSSLLTSPGGVVDQIYVALASIGDTAAAVPGDVMEALIGAYGVDLGSAPDPVTTTREREISNLLAITGALRRVFAIEAARLAPSVPYTTLEDATSARDRIGALLDQQADGAGDTAYPSLVALRSDLMRAVPGAGVFPGVVAESRRVAIPSLVLAYQLYGAVDLESDVIARNRVAHPGFISGDLQVISGNT